MSDQQHINIQSYASTLPAEKSDRVKRLSLSLQNALQSKGKLNLIFICTHNSRRSQFSEVWAHALIHHYDLAQYFKSFSAGTEVSRVHPAVLNTLKRQGFQIDSSDEQIQISGDDIPVKRLYSKDIDDESLVHEAAYTIMVCAQADENCPYIDWASERFSLPLHDPGVADGTEKESDSYRQCSEEIASLLKGVFELIKQRIDD